MPVKHRVGYDIQVLMSESELYDLYMEDGNMSSKQAKVKAREVYLALKQMEEAERRSWRGVRENEFTAGLEPEIPDRSNI